MVVKVELYLMGARTYTENSIKTLFFVSVFSFHLRLMADWLVGVRAQLPVLKDIPPNDLTQVVG